MASRASIPPPFPARPIPASGDGSATPSPAPPSQDRSAPLSAPLTFLFELHDDPIWNHPLWLDHDNTVPCARVDVRTQRTAEGKHSWAPAAGPEGTVEATMKTLYRLIEGFAPHWGPRNRPLRWYMQPAGFGCVYDEKTLRAYPNAVPLLDNPADRLASGRRGPWAKRGIDANRLWAAEFMDHLAAELASRRLPDPLAFILASENGVRDDYGGHLGNPDRGWVPEALGDPRANDPEYAIDGRLTFATYYGQARCLDGSPIPEYDDTAGPAMPPGRHPKNFESSEQYRGAIRRLWEWSRFKTFAEPAGRSFARSNPKVGEYQAACDSKSSPVAVGPTLRIHQMDGFFKCSLQCPDWYGELGWTVDDAIFSPNHPGWNTVTNWSRRIDLAERDPKRRLQLLGLEVAKRQASAHAAAAPHAPLAPYVTDLRNMPVSDMIDYLRHCKSVGAWGVNIFMPESTRQGHDNWLQVVEALA